jgi:hypothetical protein
VSQQVFDACVETMAFHIDPSPTSNEFELVSV